MGTLGREMAKPEGEKNYMKLGAELGKWGAGAIE